MLHPFEKIFEKALRKSTSEDNALLVAAEKIQKKGYRIEEILGVLTRMRISRIDETEEGIITDAITEFTERHQN